MQLQRRRRHNGWSWPPSFLQLFFWIIIPLVASSTAFLLMPLHKLYAPVAVFTGTIWLVLQMIVLTCIDPAVSNLRKGQTPAHFDASKHDHVIENLFCNICLISVLATFDFFTKLIYTSHFKTFQCQQISHQVCVIRTNFAETPRVSTVGNATNVYLGLIITVNGSTTALVR